MTTITAKSVLASCHRKRPELRNDTMLLRYPRPIHAEFMTHRKFGRNAASSRAIPVEKLIQSAIDEPYIPLHWGANQKGMQADEQCSNNVILFDDIGHALECNREEAWLFARDQAVTTARAFAKAGYHKQIVNRLLEPFTHITVVVTGTQWSNFLYVRDHKDAEPHMQLLAKAIRKAYNSAEVQELDEGEWHLPFASHGLDVLETHANRIKLSTARCASTSYKTVEGFDMTLDRATELHDKLVSSDPLHASPAEHQAQVDTCYKGHSGVKWNNQRLSGNLGAGWIQYRKTLPGECR